MKKISLEYDKEKDGEGKPMISDAAPDRPHVHISHKNLKGMKHGQKVVLHGKVHSVSHTEGEDHDHHSAEIELHHMESDNKADPELDRDEDVIDKGLDEASEKASKSDQKDDKDAS